jgi:hypothetical protein
MKFLNKIVKMPQNIYILKSKHQGESYTNGQYKFSNKDKKLKANLSIDLYLGVYYIQMFFLVILQGVPKCWTHFYFHSFLDTDQYKDGRYGLYELET